MEDLEDDEGLPPMQHQALAYRPLPQHYQMDYDWEPPITVIPDSQPEEDDWPEPLAMIPDSEDGRESVRI